MISIMTQDLKETMICQMIFELINDDLLLQDMSEEIVCLLAKSKLDLVSACLSLHENQTNSLKLTLKHNKDMSV